MEKLIIIIRLGIAGLSACCYRQMNCYRSKMLWRKLNQADTDMFKCEVEKMGIECTIMKYGDEIFV